MKKQAVVKSVAASSSKTIPVRKARQPRKTAKPFRCFDENQQLTPEFYDAICRETFKSRNKQFYVDDEKIMEKINSFEELRSLTPVQKDIIRHMVRTVHSIMARRAEKLSEDLRHNVSPEILRFAL